jgi:hypothetical protein
MVSDLAHGPTAGPVGRIELLFGESRNGGAQIARGASDIANPMIAFGGSSGIGHYELPDGISKIDC